MTFTLLMSTEYNIKFLQYKGLGKIFVQWKFSAIKILMVAWPKGFLTFQIICNIDINFWVALACVHLSLVSYVAPPIFLLTHARREEGLYSSPD